MTKEKTIFYALINILLFTGCAPTYNMQVDFDKESKTISIDTLELKKARISYDKSKNSEGSHTTQIKYYLADKRCNSMYYYHKQMTRGWYITENEEDYLKQRAIDQNKINCDVSKISNLKFIKCENVSSLRKDYTITTSTTDEDGYSSSTVIDNINQTCFNTIKNHFTKKANIDDVKIETYNIGNKHSENKTTSIEKHYNPDTLKYRSFSEYAKEDELRKEYLKNGKVLSYTTDGQLYSIINKHHNKNGVISYYDKEGRLYMEHMYKNGKKDGIQKKYFKTGILMSTSNYKNGNVQRNGIIYGEKDSGVKQGYYHSGQLKYETPYSKRLFHGVAKKYYENGKLKWIATYKAGNLHGQIKTYYSNGVVAELSSYINDKKNGIHKNYYEKGTLKSERAFKNGNGVGKAKGYFDNGQLKWEEQYLNGEKSGIWESYYMSGKIRLLETYKNGKRHGEKISYQEDGKIKWQKSYDNGVFIR